MLPRPLRQGTEEQRSASAPSLGRHKSLLLRFKSLAAQGRNLSGKQNRARASFRLSSWPGLVRASSLLPARFSGCASKVALYLSRYSHNWLLA